MNFSLMFDNVLWGDECFSANTARKDVDSILQVMYFWENHPPLYYYWAKIFGEVFGYTGWVFHLASLTPFFIGIVIAFCFMRKRLGNVPTAFFILITGVASSCIRYNLEIRMYSLAFLGVAVCYYCAYRIFGGSRLAWVGMVFWALVGAYSHYYAMMTCGILIFITGVAAVVRFGGRTWLKSVAALLAYIVGYSPWFPYLFHGTGNVMNNWWMTEVMGVRDSLQMILCGSEFEKIVACLLIVILVPIFLVESSFFEVIRPGKATTDNMIKSNCANFAKKAMSKEKIEIILHRPFLRGWSNQAYGAAIGILTIVGTLIAAYLLCLVVGPVLTGRYLYPTSAITIVLLVISSSELLNLLEAADKRYQKVWLKISGKTVLLLILLILMVIGIGNYKAYRSEVMAEKTVTNQVLDIIGDVPEETALVSNHVDHLAWTVLYYYYPHRKVVTGRCSDEGADYDCFWYFTPEVIGRSELREMKEMGYEVQEYGSQQIATYPFELYYFEKTGKQRQTVVE